MSPPPPVSLHVDNQIKRKNNKKSIRTNTVPKILIQTNTAIKFDSQEKSAPTCRPPARPISSDDRSIHLEGIL
jgi:hypothetical protein